jgi:hypothetical protein
MENSIEMNINLEVNMWCIRIAWESLHACKKNIYYTWNKINYSKRLWEQKGNILRHINNSLLLLRSESHHW